MRETGSGSIYFDVTNTWLPSEGLFVDATGMEGHEFFSYVLTKSSGINEIGRYEYHDVVNKLVANYGLVVVTLSDRGVTMISKNKRPHLSPEQIGRIEDMFGVSPSDTISWTDAINASGIPVRHREVPAQAAIFGGYEYRSSSHDDKPSKEDHDREEMAKFAKTVRPEPKITSVEDPNKPKTAP